MLEIAFELKRKESGLTTLFFLEKTILFYLESITVPADMFNKLQPGRTVLHLPLMMLWMRVRIP